MNDIQFKKFKKKCYDNANSVRTTLIEYLTGDKNFPIQCWYHYDSAEIRIVEDTLFFMFFVDKVQTAAFGTKINGVKLQRLLNLPHVGKHYHVLVGNDNTLVYPSEDTSFIEIHK